MESDDELLRRREAQKQGPVNSSIILPEQAMNAPLGFRKFAQINNQVKNLGEFSHCSPNIQQD